MSQRVDPFADLNRLPSFEVKPKAVHKPVEHETIDRISTENNFPSRQAPKPVKEPKRKRRVYRTGRNQQFNLKASTETVERFCKMADERNIPLCALLERALDALEARDREKANINPEIAS